MGLVTYERPDAAHGIGVRRGSDVVPVNLLDSGADVDNLTDCLPIIDSLESEAGELISNTSAPDDVHHVSEVVLHSPVDPEKVVRIEGSYSHDLVDEEYNPFIDTEGLRERDWPRFWVAPMSAMSDATDPLVLPTFASEAKPSVELALVVGTSGKNWSPEEATEAIAACQVMADIGIYDALPGQWGYKFFDSAMTFGTDLIPSSELELSGLDLSLELDGEVVDVQSTNDWRFSPGEMVSIVSEIMSLRPGDIITTGNPMRVDGVDPGNELRATVENVGEVTSMVRREQTDAEVLI